MALIRAIMILFFLVSCSTAPVVKQGSPPENIVVEKPRKPYQNSIWIKGRWKWKEERYVWVQGRWTKPRRGYEWVDGYWVRRSSDWLWVQGQWQKIVI